MDKEELKSAILSAVEEYLAAEESFDDNAQLLIDTVSGKVFLENGGDVEESEEIDSYDVMDLITMSASEPGRWNPDMEAIEEVASSY